MSGYTYTGASGQLYAYHVVSTADLGKLPMQAGNYIFALNDAARTPVFIEAADSVRAAVLGQGLLEWDKAQMHGAALVLIHIDPALDMAARQFEKTDLIACYHQPMSLNPDHPE